MKKVSRGGDNWKDVVDDFNKGYKVGDEEQANRKLLAKLRPMIEAQKRKRGLKEASHTTKCDENNYYYFSFNK